MTARLPYRSVRLALVATVAVALLELVGPSPASAAPEVGTADWRAVSAGSGSTCGIRTSGRLYCWGSDTDGLLGNGGGVASEDTPIEVEGGHTNWQSVSAGAGHACGIRGGHLYCWGDGSEGQLGVGEFVWESGTPLEVTGALAGWTSVSAGEKATCGIRAGRLYCWGLDEHGLVANGAGGQTYVPTEAAGHHSDWTTVSVLAFHACGRRATGRLYCWGEDFAGQLGNGALAGIRTAPSAVAGNRTDWTSVTVGAFHTCARRRPGRVFCWGADNYGQQGNGSVGGARTAPAEVAGGRVDWTMVSAAGSGTCGRRQTGRLYCWGDDAEGRLGDGTPVATNRQAPIEVYGRRTDWRSVSSGSGAHACALRTTGRVFCWGYDSQGQLGVGGGAVNRYRPTEIAA